MTEEAVMEQDVSPNATAELSLVALTPAELPDQQRALAACRGEQQRT